MAAPKAAKPHVTQTKSAGPTTAVGLTKVVLQVVPKGTTVAALKAKPRADLETALGIDGQNGSSFLISTDASGAVLFTLKPGRYKIRGKTRTGLVAKLTEIVVAGGTCAVVLAVS